jgi:prephenate dehydrogenase
MDKKSVGIIGLGLMGGSLSLALQKSSNDYKFIGYDHNQNHCKEALKLNLVEKIAKDIEEIKKCDIIVLTIPVDGIIKVLQDLIGVKQDTTIIDFGSTKEKICASIPSQIRANFVAAHPMAGTEKFGPNAAIDYLYKDKVVVLCDVEKSGNHQVEVAKKLFKDISMQIVFMGAKEHDRHAAYISHMPHALSYSLANAVMNQEQRESIIALAGGGFKDMSRIAKSSPTMWEDIFRQNQTNLIEAIESFQKELKKCKKMVENQEWEELNSWMAQANKLHEIL